MATNPQKRGAWHQLCPKPPRPYITPTPRRLPQGKRMTIALGILANDGVIIAADTQETVGYSKLNQGKVAAFGHRRPDGHWRQCLFSGAGPAVYIDACRDQFMKAFASEQSNADANIATIFDISVRDFHEQRIVPLARLPDDRPYVQLILAVQDHQTVEIWRAEQNVIVSGTPFSAVGIGSDLALSILGRMYRLPMLDVPNTILLAAYVMAQVKASKDGCGLETDIYCLRGTRGMNRVRREDAAMLESAMSDYIDTSEPSSFREVIGEAWTDGRAPLRDARKLLRGLLRRLRRSDEQYYQFLD